MRLTELICDGSEYPYQVNPNLADPRLKSAAEIELIGVGPVAALTLTCGTSMNRGGSKGFILLTYDTTPGYNDTQPFPAAPTKWSCRAIYRVGDQQVGKWSNTVSVTTGCEIFPKQK